MTTRYFYSEIATRPLEGGPVKIVFEKTGIIGSNICGIYAAADVNEIALLAGAVSQRAGVVEITKEEYDQQRAQKKTVHNSQHSLTLRPVSQVSPPAQMRVAEKQGAESAERAGQPSSSKLESVEVDDPMSVIKVDTVASPGLVQESERTAPVSTAESSSNQKANRRANKKA
jgi:hypothetical protein